MSTRRSGAVHSSGAIFASTDVHAAIDLHRIAQQHFGRKTSCQTVGNIALTNRRRTDDRNGGKTCPGRNASTQLAHNGAGQIPGLGNVDVNINDLANELIDAVTLGDRRMHGLILGTLAQQDRVVLTFLNERRHHSVKLTLGILMRVVSITLTKQ